MTCDHGPRYDGLNDWACYDRRSGPCRYLYCPFWTGTSEGVLVSLRILYSSNPQGPKQSECQDGACRRAWNGIRLCSQMYDSLAYYAHRCFGPASPDHGSICDPGVHRCQDFESPFLVINF